MELNAKILTVSDSVVAGTRVDESSPALATRLRAAGYDITELRVTSDGVEPVALALGDLVGDVLGASERRTREALAAAEGGVLVIDEAYGLYSGGDGGLGGVRRGGDGLCFYGDARIGGLGLHGRLGVR